MPVLSPRQLNRALLARQLLLERAPVTVPEALDLMGCLQAQYAPSMYVGLWSRVDGFVRQDLTRALQERAVAQGTLMRITIHLASAGDYWPLALAVRDARRVHWLRSVRHAASAAEMEVLAAELRARLGDGPLRRSELDQLVGRERSIGVGLWLDLVRVPPSGTWERRRADLYGAAEDWLGLPPADLTVEAATEHLVRRYLGGFGPATAADVADWAGLPAAGVLDVLERLDLRRFTSEEGRQLYDLPAAPRPDGSTPAPVRFLPTWDASLLVHARGKGIVAEAVRPLIFNTRTPHSMCTFLVDGTVAGTWRFDKGRIVVHPFEPLPAAVRRQVDDEAERLAAFHT